MTKKSLHERIDSLFKSPADDEKVNIRNTLELLKEARAALDPAVRIKPSRTDRFNALEFPEMVDELSAEVLQGIGKGKPMHTTMHMVAMMVLQWQREHAAAVKLVKAYEKG